MMLFWYTHQGLLFDNKNKIAVMKYSGKWMELEKIILNKDTQVQKNKQMRFLTCGS